VPLGRKQFVRRRPQDPESPKSTSITQRETLRVSDKSVSASSPRALDGETAKNLIVSDHAYEGQYASDIKVQDLLRDVLYELKHIRLHMEALSGEDLRGDVDYADQ
jgi:hypothetical protein